MAGRVAAVVVDHDAGPLLEGCVQSLLRDGAASVVVVENGAVGSVAAALRDLRAEPASGPAARSGPAASEPADPTEIVRIVQPGRNVGYGAGVNRGLAALAGDASPPEWVLVCNADLVVHAGTLAALRRALESEHAWALVGPRIFTEAGEVYPSVRNFPSFTDAAGHALLAQFNPENPFTLRYNPGTPEGDVVTGVGWVSGSCFLARRSALEELGGFDETYFMYLEDTDLCWRAHHAGWGVGFAGTAAVTHVQGVSTARHPYRMMAAHHRSALRFTVRTTTGWRRAALPLAVVVLAARMAIATARLAFGR